MVCMCTYAAAHSLVASGEWVTDHRSLKQSIGRKNRSIWIEIVILTPKQKPRQQRHSDSTPPLGVKEKESE